ncbi:hypothetical protein PGRAN_13788 [Listeria grandensis FSL F6-0971]|uniref:Peptidase M60 domain-containing protein n=1 Tax=Listeria grandensis FSL F6-0971 TaxID=1265819 RepID=W7BFN1_9LIST|nr:M60 family metallopeptidase [Listeria grandensis]EUJ21976.1 hypothetical protein PGRAN_13788 [Listeria grandensis FSL F6-0971]
MKTKVCIWGVSLFLFACCMLVITTHKVHAEEAKNIVTVSGKGSIENERKRLERVRKFSELTPTQYYVKKGEQIRVSVSGGTGSSTGILLAVGTPGTPTGIMKTSVDRGENVITADRSGVLSFINRQESGKIIFAVNSKHDNIPFFVLEQTTNEDFAKQMAQYKNASIVQFVSKKALITVSYANAQKYVKNPEKLMTYYEQFLDAQNKVEGTVVEGREDYLAAQHLQHFVESDHGYMFATNEYMGFYGDAALQRLLTTDNGWGVWHESGHQRQLAPMTWSAATESTVNIYSMAVQKEITGKLTALDSHYPAIRNYLNLPIEKKEYDKQDNNIKMGLYGQLMDVFGDSFYPQLHQKYRLLEKQPNSTDEKKQVLIIQSSQLAQINLIPFFEKWGLLADADTKELLNQLPILDEPIWENTNTKKYHLNLPQVKYVPQLPYFKQVVKKIESRDNLLKITLDMDWIKGYKYVVTKNNNYIGEVIDGNSSGGERKIEREGYVFSIHTPVLSTDQFQVVVHHEGAHVLKTYNSYDQNIENQLNQLFTDSTQSELQQGVGQGTLNLLLQAIQKSSNQEPLLKLHEKGQRLLLEGLIRDISYKNQQVNVAWASNVYKNYHTVLTKNGKYISEINNGNPYYSSTQNLNWKTTVGNLADSDILRFEFRLPDKTYTVNVISGKVIKIKNALEDMYDVSGSIKNTVNQEGLNDILIDINNYSSTKQKAMLMSLFDHVQRDLLKGMIQSVAVNDSLKIETIFANATYQQYQIVAVKNDIYTAEMHYGTAYSSVFSNNSWRISTALVKGDKFYLEVRLPHKSYKIVELTK